MFFTSFLAVIAAPPVRREITARPGERRAVCWLRLIFAETFFGLFVLTGSQLALLFPEPLISAVLVVGVVLAGFLLTLRPVATTLQLMAAVLLVVGLIAVGNQVTDGDDRMRADDRNPVVVRWLREMLRRLVRGLCHRGLDGPAPMLT